MWWAGAGWQAWRYWHLLLDPHFHTTKHGRCGQRWLFALLPAEKRWLGAAFLATGSLTRIEATSNPV
jgi:hypothetical protein